MSAAAYTTIATSWRQCWIAWVPSRCVASASATAVALRDGSVTVLAIDDDPGNTSAATPTATAAPSAGLAGHPEEGFAGH